MKRHQRKPGTENSAITSAGSAATQRKAGVNNIMQMPTTPLIRREAAPSPGDVVSGKIETTRGSGSSMADGTKSFMENRFGTDFSAVKIHTGDYAAQISNDLNARAFTIGNDIYFNSGKYAPGTSDGKRLLAHELTHVAQQRSTGGQIVQRAPLAGTQSSTASYNLDGWSNKQVKAGGTSPFPNAKVSYDESSSEFRVTFSMAWIFPHGWNDSKRDGYVSDFETAVRDIWEDRFLLKEQGGKKRTTHVKIDFDKTVVHQMKDANEEAAALNNSLISKPAWTMDARIVNIRDNVSFRTVQLDENANKNHSAKGSAIRAGTGFSVNDGNDNQTFTQNTSAHEFGHMIGLGDEYLNDSGTSASQIDPARAHINNRIMNVGNTVTADVYAPFADWLSALTTATWIVGSKVR
ncbi:eCIS core domain-containing protein [Mucilaginibacter xinganensis]|uniref:eCIS core domain-containing protein n=1 Tax=Mucilaginibacter xinganensis TaxID=1234841 RepID=A0A223NVL5_9SPHI|nr:DUF4157 domain-containing protein [Mucilaginibacter xinganensis]ASU33913.1 hypothetical protein MuYL_2021 [Mucilaginibacter xinganensis]